MRRGLVISAPASGTGKTTLTLALARAFTRRGLAVQCFKCGPDYIDPAFHKVASSRASYNLDSWAMQRDAILALVERPAPYDLAIAEGAMGLFDGAARTGAAGTGACADIAELTGWPVLLVIDPAGQAQTAAAVAKGLSVFRRGLSVAGVILNRVASPRHEAQVRAGMQDAGIAVLGALPRRAPIALPERHLGLVQAEELDRLDDVIDAAAALVSEHVDLDAVHASARLHTVSRGTPALDAKQPAVRPPGLRIALARDAAFSFIYPHLVDAWRDAGAQILPFSPLADEAPDTSADVCWLPGGYPELHAGRLAGARTFQAALRSFAQTRPVHGECGGYMAMGAGLVDASGTRHEMAGLLGLETSFAARRLHLGYRTAQLLRPLLGHRSGTRLNGHEFHYASVVAQPDEPLAVVCDATGQPVAETGSRRGNASGSYFHMIAEAA